MDYSKIQLKNERNQHVTKRLNRLKTWGFFKVLYRDNMWRLFGFSLLMLICLLPIFGIQIWKNYDVANFKLTYPMHNSLGFSTGVWTTVMTDYNAALSAKSLIFGLITVGASMLVFITLSGGLAVIRDAFWTGKLSTVGVFKSVGKGIKANWAYAIITNIIVAFAVFGTIVLYKWLAAKILWLAIVVVVLMAILLLLIVTYLAILCSVTVTYKQSVKENLSDAWRLMWLNFLPNILHIIISFVPVSLYFVLSGDILQSIYLVLMIMFGGMFFPLVWQTFMMRTFALFHPVEKKSKSNKEAQPAIETSEQASADDKSAKQPAKKSSKKATVVKKATSVAAPVVAEATPDDVVEGTIEQSAPADEAVEQSFEQAAGVAEEPSDDKPADDAAAE